MSDRPPLPDPDCPGVHFDGHSADQMRAYYDLAAAERDALRERVSVLTEVVESAAAADVFKDSPGAMDRLAEYARAALQGAKP